MQSRGERLARATLLLMGTVALSRVLGYGREVALNTLFGQSYTTDAYRAAFAIPDLIYLLLAGGALSAVFIPIFSSYLETGQEVQAWKSASIIFNYVVFFTLILIVLAFFLAPDMMRLLFPGLPGDYQALGTRLTRIMFLQTVFMAFNGFAMGILNSHHRFTAPAVGALVYNLFIILAGLALYRYIGIEAFSYGVVIGAAFSFLVQIPSLKKVGIKYYFSFNLQDPGLRRTLSLMVPIMAGLGVGQVNLLINQNLASGLGPGIISALDVAQKIMQVPMGILAGSIGVTIFPTLAVLSARGELDEFKRAFSLGIRLLLVLTIPASLGMMAIREPLVALFFQQGNLTAAMAALTSQALFFYCLGLFAYTGLQVLNRGFFSLQDTITPVIAASIAVVSNGFLSIAFSRSWHLQGLALAYSLAGFINFFILFVVLRWRLGQLGGRKILKSLTCSVLAALIMYALVRMGLVWLALADPGVGKASLAISVAGGTAAGVFIYTLLLLPFKLEEVGIVLGMAAKRFKLTG